MTNVSLSTSDAGLYHAPNRVTLSFQLLDSRGHFTTSLPESALELTVLFGGRSYPVPVRTLGREGRLMAFLDLPIVGGPGPADLRLSLKDGERTLDQAALPRALRYGAMALDLVFLIDNSGSMGDNDGRGVRFQSVISCLSAAEANWAVRRAALIVFSDKPAVAIPFATPGEIRDSAQIRERLQALKAGGSTEMPAALRLAADLIAQRREAVKTAVILLTDGASTTPLSDEGKRFHGLGVPIYTVGLHAGASKEYDPALLARLAKETGGFFSDGRAPDLAGLYLRALGHLMAVRENLAIAPPPESAWSDEAPVLPWTEIQKFRGMQVSLASEDRPWEILLVRSNGSRREAILAPFPPGRHLVSAAWRDGARDLARRDWSLVVQAQRAPLRLSGDFAPRIPLLRRQAVLSFSVENLSGREARLEGEFLPLLGGEGRVIEASRFGPEEPLTPVAPHERRSLAFHVDLAGLEPGLYAGAFLLRADSHWQAANLSLELLPQGPEPTSFLAPAPPKRWGSLPLVGTCLVTVLWALLFVVNTLLTRVASRKKNS
ncbi:MAG: VWA domain-containing protein [Spirochaetes bacterium]|nr:VWA domain-containing protein [Spirochaetota bacterium]